VLKGAPFPSISSCVTCKFTQGQQLPEYKVSGGMSTDDGPQPPATVPMSFEFPVAIPGAPPPPGPNIITIGPRPLKVPICKECDKQRKMIGKLVASIEHDNHKAQDIQEQQDDMIESYRSGPHCVRVMLRHTLQRTETHCNALQHAPISRDTNTAAPLQHIEIRCDTVLHSTTRCLLAPSPSPSLSLSCALSPPLSSPVCLSVVLSPCLPLHNCNHTTSLSFLLCLFFPLHTCAHIYIYVYDCIYTHMRTHTHTHSHTLVTPNTHKMQPPPQHTHAHTHKHTITKTHTQAPLSIS